MSEARYEALRSELFWDAFWAFLPWTVGASIAVFLLILLALQRRPKP